MLKALTTRTPATVSWSVEVRSAMASCEAVLLRLSLLPTVVITRTLKGSSTRETSVSCQLRISRIAR